MIRKSEAEMARWRMTKAARMLIRLQKSLEADEEINRILPEKLEQFDAALQRGEILELSVSLEE